MLGLVLDALACVLVGAIGIHSVVLHIRLGRLREALAEMGQVLPAFDASVNRVAAMVDGFTVTLGAELEGMEGRLTAARRLNTDLATASRAAEDAAGQLDRLLRQHKRLEALRVAVLPRELVEPKGFAERAGLPPVRLPPACSAATSWGFDEDGDQLAGAMSPGAAGGPA
jgi:hypothetical protein